VKKVRQAVEENNKDEAVARLREATRTLHSAASKGVIHRNSADRRISRLAKLVNKLG
jgi:small subunit ribosomal protein S20